MSDDTDTETANETGDSFDPTEAQADIITSDAYPMRVLAGAGTGKTFTMVRKIERLLDNDIPPEEILALTFTNKAADSIREKLVAEIGPRANDIDAYTYHAIGEALLRDRAYEAGLDPRYEIATEVDQLQFIYESLDEIPYWFTSPRVAAPGEHGGGAAAKLTTFIPQMKGEGIRPQDLTTYLGAPQDLIALNDLVDRLEERAETLLDFGRWQKPTPERLEEDMVEPLQEFKSELEDERDGLRPDGLEGDIRVFLTELQELCDALIHLFEEQQDEIVDDGPLKPTFRLPALLFNAKYGNGDATGLPRIAQTPMDRLRAVIESCQAARDLTEGYDAYERRLQAENMVDFGDLVTRSRDLFSESAENADEGTIQSDWTYVFCDEFQDTDTVQFDLVAELVGDGELFVVGDVYQAIYEWRGANIENIEERLTSRFAPTDEDLTENFRSYEPILGLANNAFRQHPGHDSINELKPGTDGQTVGRGVATITAPPDEESRRSVIDDEKEAALIAEAILELLGGETDLVTDDDLDRQEDDDRVDPTGYRAEDIAVLVRATKHARPIIEALETAGIPYSLGGSLAAESVGVQTVIAYLKLLANPERDDSLNRVLTMRYRVRDTDLQTLNHHDGSLYQTVLTADLDSLGLVEPDPVMTARDDLEYLLSIRETHSLSGLYEELKETTRIEWFLTETEQSDLEYLDELIAEYGRERVQPELSESFIEFLQYNATTVLEGGGGVQDQPDTTSGAVNIMTVHKSKGLEFPVVILPQLTAKEWDPRQQSNAALRHALGDATASPFDSTLVRRDEFEQRRAFHVAVTRARNLCVLSGRTESEDNDDDDELTRAEVAPLFPESMRWCLHPNRFPVWETVQESLPDSAVDWTEELRTVVEGDRNEMVRTAAGAELPLGEAFETVLSTARQAINGAGTPVEPDEFGLPATPVEPAPIDLLPKHSYTSISDWERCPRQHYLDHVVNAFEDPDPALLETEESYIESDRTEEPTAGSVSLREVGLLFHQTAERADQQSHASPADRKARWQTVADNHGRYSDAVREKVHRCIDVFFETAASEWTVLSTERWFDFTYDDTHRIVGQIDAVCETPDGEVAILDYKTAFEQRPENMQYQLPIYLHAANAGDIVERVDKAAYVYVNDEFADSTRVVEQPFDADWVGNRMEAIRATIDELEQSTYVSAEPQAGSWCYDCSHRSLPCSNESRDHS